MEHKIEMVNREYMDVIGVLDVIAFNEEEILIETEKGLLIIRGINLHINKLNLENGELAVEGYVYSLSYEETMATKSKGVFNKIFK